MFMYIYYETFLLSLMILKSKVRIIIYSNNNVRVSTTNETY